MKKVSIEVEMIKDENDEVLVSAYIDGYEICLESIEEEAFVEFVSEIYKRGFQMGFRYPRT